MDPVLPLPRTRMLSVKTYFSLGISISSVIIIYLLLVFKVMLIILCAAGIVPCFRRCPFLPSIYWPCSKWVVSWSATRWNCSCMAYYVVAVYSNMSVIISKLICIWYLVLLLTGFVWCLCQRYSCKDVLLKCCQVHPCRLQLFGSWKRGGRNQHMACFTWYWEGVTYVFVVSSYWLEILIYTCLISSHSRRKMENSVCFWCFC